MFTGITNKIKLVLVASVATGGILFGAATPAHASTYGTFDAWCGYNHSVTVEGPDLTQYQGWSTRWYPTLSVWTSAGWRTYRTGPVQTQNGPGTWTLPDAITSWTFPSLPAGYYQARVTYTYFFNGVAQGTYPDRSLVHKPVPNDPFNYYVVNYSTSAYCYEG